MAAVAEIAAAAANRGCRELVYGHGVADLRSSVRIEPDGPAKVRDPIRSVNIASGRDPKTQRIGAVDRIVSRVAEEIYPGAVAQRIFRKEPLQHGAVVACPRVVQPGRVVVFHPGKQVRIRAGGRTWFAERLPSAPLGTGSG